MHSLYHLLHVTSSFHLEENGDQGVLYWLGIGQQPDTKIHTQRFNIMTPEEFGEIGEDYDDGEYSCKTLVPLPRSCHLWCSIIL